MKKLLVMLGLVAAVLVAPATASAASDATPGKLVTRITESSQPSQRAGYIHRQVTITQTRSGITGGRLWDVSEHVDWQTRAGWVWNTSMQRSAHGSTWENDGPVWTNHWGCDGCVNEGWTTKWHMASVPRAPLITENNYPQISVTVYGSQQSNGHYYTYSRSCGC